MAISSPGTTSVSQAVAARRSLWPTAASATIIASPIVSEPTVSAVRLGSRMSAPRASRSSARSTSANGMPTSRARNGRMNGDSSVASSSRP